MAVAATASDFPEYDPGVPPGYAWLVFALTFSLLLSDYMSRQVLNAVFPLLKSEWALSDAQLGGLSSIVALMVALLTIPLSFAADKFGRVRSLVAMAIVWSLATLACGLARDYSEMFWARLMVGVGEAAYGSVGIALIFSLFPARMRSGLGGAFMAGGMIGSVIGVATGGIVAGLHGWRSAFIAMSVFGMVLALLYIILVRPSKLIPRNPAPVSTSTRAPLASLFGSPSVLLTYVASGLQLFMGTALIAWLPSLLNRYYAVDVGRAGPYAAIFLLIAGFGMIVCGALADRVARKAPQRIAVFAALLCFTTFVLFSVAFRLPPGPFQLALLGFGMFLTSGTAGPATAMVGNLTHVAAHGSAFALLTFANNLFGIAPAPYVTGWLADQTDLMSALASVAAVSLVSTLLFALLSRTYAGDLRRQTPVQPAESFS